MISAGFVAHRIITRERSLSRKIVTLTSMGDSNQCPTIVDPRESFRASKRRFRKTLPKFVSKICKTRGLSELLPRLAQSGERLTSTERFIDVKADESCRFDAKTLFNLQIVIVNQPEYHSRSYKRIKSCLR